MNEQATLYAARGWPHGQHRHLYEVAQRLADEVGDNQIRARFAIASDLHANFYEDYLRPIDVQFHLNEVTQLVQRIEAILSDGPLSDGPVNGA